MGQSASSELPTEAWGGDHTNTGPAEAWGSESRRRTRAGAPPGISLVPQPAPLTIDGYSQYDAQEESLRMVQYEAERLARSDRSREHREIIISSTMGGDDRPSSLLQPQVDASTPAWAQSPQVAEACSSELELQFVYGLGEGGRNIYLLPTGEVAFYVGKLVVVYEPKRRHQRFLVGHDLEVRCLALHPSGAILASGQGGCGQMDGPSQADPDVCVWQTDTAEPIVVLGTGGGGGIATLQFSSDGNQLVSVGADEMHTVVVWDWRRSFRVASANAQLEAIFDVCWSPDDSCFVTAGGMTSRIRTHAATGLQT